MLSVCLGLKSEDVKKTAINNKIPIRKWISFAMDFMSSLSNNKSRLRYYLSLDGAIDKQISNDEAIEQIGTMISFDKDAKRAFASAFKKNPEFTRLTNEKLQKLKPKLIKGINEADLSKNVTFLEDDQN